MKKVLFAALLACLMFSATFALAADVVLDKEIKSISFKKDKNGNEYAQIIISETTTLSGVSYDKDIIVMAFGATSAPLKGYKKGQTFKAVASEGSYNGNKTYTVLKVVK